ncbi:unnamed protein product [Kuraishia capsulata CBS 1993]|uniref:Uncharacterized protein n=1 Tax=Kuraishia capsulata CBS 1993 TaxID=1382522 RepID=W6MGP9_9ASCO|nr:uncharacterized protein KUCA_T00000719001 [Kuraishia capsulata CBS 1993]CDK24753.1 unnamed protein product [Kuraishia capsulata CBS 1993]
MGLPLDSEDRHSGHSKNKRVRISENGAYVYPTSDTQTPPTPRSAMHLTASSEHHEDLEQINDMLLDPPPWTLQNHHNELFSRLGIPIFTSDGAQGFVRRNGAGTTGLLRGGAGRPLRYTPTVRSDTLRHSPSGALRRRNSIYRRHNAARLTDLDDSSGQQRVNLAEIWSGTASAAAMENDSNQQQNGDDHGSDASIAGNDGDSGISPIAEAVSPPQVRDLSTTLPRDILESMLYPDWMRPQLRRRYETFDAAPVPPSIRLPLSPESMGRRYVQAPDEYSAGETSDDGSDILTDSDPMLDPFTLNRTGVRSGSSGAASNMFFSQDDDWDIKETRARFSLMQRGHLYEINYLNDTLRTDPVFMQKVLEQSIKRFGQPMASGTVPEDRKC